MTDFKINLTLQRARAWVQRVHVCLRLRVPFALYLAKLRVRMFLIRAHLVLRCLVILSRLYLSVYIIRARVRLLVLRGFWITILLHYHLQAIQVRILLIRLANFLVIHSFIRRCDRLITKRG